jgi:hypothetical protein
MKTYVSAVSRTRRSFLAKTAAAIAGISILQRRAKAAPPTACGVWCTIAVLTIILGIAIWLLIRVFKACQKLAKKIGPRVPEEHGPGSLIPNTPSIAGKPTLRLDTLGDPVGVQCWDITDAGFLDQQGFPYCVMFEFDIESRTPAGQWQTVAKVYGYLSFSSTQVMDWQTVQGVPCYWRYAAGLDVAKTMTINVVRNGMLVGVSHSAVEQMASTSEPINIPAPGASSELFRLKFPWA